MSQRSAADKSAVIPHTRLEDDDAFHEIYQQGGQLGSGSFGIVWQARHMATGQEWACKCVNKDREKAGSTAIKLLAREVAILKEVQHEHIIRLKEVFETSKKMYLIMEYCKGGNLKAQLKKKSKFREVEVKVITERLASAISYLHRNDMVHRDIKLENILLNQNPRDKSDDLYIKVTDFGLSMKKSGVGHDNMMMDYCGTLVYMAPEIIDNKTYSEKCDVWAMGVIMYTLLCGSEPFLGRDEEIIEFIKNADIRTHFDRDIVWKSISEEAKDCLCCMLDRNPASRTAASEILTHPWIKGEPLGNKPLNVLELMRDFKEEEECKDGAINGDLRGCDPRDGGSQGGESSLDEGACSSGPPSRDSSAGRKTKQNSAGARRTSLPKVLENRNSSGRKGNQRGSLDSLLHPVHATSSSTSGKVSRNGTLGKGTGSGTGVAKGSSSKSPVNKDTVRSTSGGSGGIRSTAGQSYHGAKTSATKTSAGSSGSSSSAGSSKTQPTDATRVRKKVSR